MLQFLLLFISRSPGWTKVGSVIADVGQWSGVVTSQLHFWLVVLWSREFGCNSPSGMSWRKLDGSQQPTRHLNLGIELFSEFSIHVFLNCLVFKDLCTGWTYLVVHLQKTFDNQSQVRTIRGGDGWVNPFTNFLSKAFHVVCHKGRSQCSHFINYCSKRPNIGFVRVRLVAPYLWRGVVRSSCLSL